MWIYIFSLCKIQLCFAAAATVTCYFVTLFLCFLLVLVSPLFLIIISASSSSSVVQKISKGARIEKKKKEICFSLEWHPHTPTHMYTHTRSYSHWILECNNKNSVCFIISIPLPLCLSLSLCFSQSLCSCSCSMFSFTVRLVISFFV